MAQERDTFSDQEVGLILRRAAELQGRGGASLEELESAAADAGIDRALVERAAAEVLEQRLHPSVPAPRTGVFGPTRLIDERIVAGRREVLDGESVVAEIRRQLGVLGRIEQTGREFAWSSRGPGERRIRVTVTPRRNRTVVRVEERAGGLAGGVFGGILGGLFLPGLGWILPVAILADRPWLIPIFLMAWVLASYGLARTIYRGVLTARREQLRDLALGVTEVVHELPSGGHG